MLRRLPAIPPALPGFASIHLLGSGGFADVFLYEQNMPRRQVAVKVMLSEVVNDHVRQMFQAEANLMAQLSSHPSILTVYQASVSADGRPYLVMELCSSSLNERYRRTQIPVAEVLRIAVKIGSAIETAHRSGVLHRDIKPSNILLTAYGHPVLSDFGIASSLSDLEDLRSVGLSIPWSAPEVLVDGLAGGIASEVWSFAATVYSLLAGRSPFEIPDRENRSAELISRIARARPQPIARPDVPIRLEQALARSMSKRPESRFGTVLELVRELQAIESELGLGQTAFEVVMEDWARQTVSDLGDRTRIRRIAHSVPTNRLRWSKPGQQFSEAEQFQSSLGGDGPLWWALQGRSIRSAKRRLVRTLGWGLTLSVLLVVAVVASFTLLAARPGAIPRVTNIDASSVKDTIRFSWADPGLGADDSYQVTTSDGQSALQGAAEFFAHGSTDASGKGPVCITVAVNRQGLTGPLSAQKCVAFRAAASGW